MNGKLLPKDIADSRRFLYFSKTRRAERNALSCAHMKTPFYIVLTINILQILFIVLTAAISPSFFLFYLAMVGIQIPILWVSKFFQREYSSRMTPYQLIKQIRREQPYGEWTLINYTTSQKCFLAPERRKIANSKTTELRYPSYQDVSPGITGL